MRKRRKPRRTQPVKRLLSRIRRTGSSGGGEAGPMKLLVGLGNPGPKYDGTRHNVGFAVVARLAEELQAGRPRAQGPALVSPVRDGSARLVLAQPLTYMNRSGHAVRHLLNFYKIG